MEEEKNKSTTDIANQKFFIKRNEPIDEGIKRLLKQEIDHAVFSITKQENWEKGIHEARKCFKKVRAVLRLIRKDIGEERYISENHFFRDIARKFSELRDATVCLETIYILQEQYNDSSSEDAFKKVIEKLKRDKASLKTQKSENSQVFEQVVESLNKAKERIEQWPLEPNNWRCLLTGIHKSYEKGSRTFIESYQAPSDFQIHEWRKSAKHLWFHSLLLKRCWTHVISSYAKELKKLSEKLGLHNDLAVLKSKIKKMEDTTEESKHFLLNITNEHQLNLRNEAYPLAQKIFAENPKAFKQRLGKYLETWRG